MFKWESLLVTSKGGREGTLATWSLIAFFFEVAENLRLRVSFYFLSLAD